MEMVLAWFGDLYGTREFFTCRLRMHGVDGLS